MVYHQLLIILRRTRYLRMHVEHQDPWCSHNTVWSCTNNQLHFFQIPREIDPLLPQTRWIFFLPLANTPLERYAHPNNTYEMFLLLAWAKQINFRQCFADFGNKSHLYGRACSPNAEPLHRANRLEITILYLILFCFSLLFIFQFYEKYCDPYLTLFNY